MIESVIEQHWELAAFLWARRDAAAVSHHYTATKLDELDDRLEAHLDGLRIAGDPAFGLGRESLSLDRAGAVFAFGQLALSLRRPDLFATLLDEAAPSAELSRGLVSALGWAPFEDVEDVLCALLDVSCPEPLKQLGLGGFAAHRRDPGAPLGDALSAAEPQLLARALRSAAELGRVDLLPRVVAQLEAGDRAVRGWAAWSAVLLGDRSQVPRLWELASSDDALGLAAVKLASRASEPGEATRQLEQLAASTEGVRPAVFGTAALGDPIRIPWLIEQMRVAEHARAAGAAVQAILGIDLRAARLMAEAPPEDAPGPNDDPNDPVVDPHPDHALPWPDPEGVHRFVGSQHFPAGLRLLAGKPIEPAWLSKVLAAGKQALRAAAAEELVLLEPGTPLREVRARA
ncbi:MAG: TIGR02270 family protein [Deltaproteobacteria bacterium]|jgi:uncharacterized protein (TIGR02270 family)|nr:TIGR02270 family protein [Deltaproteobacteria bacterium]MBW2530531.1 TIGR02270 family protein [Deltaproteobacteria bacterium]